jgi:exodeoxyribonuclease VII large subunit
LSNLPLSVSELNRLARSTLERGIPLTWVTGEISNLVRAASGHVYFTLKDAAAQVRCVMFRSRAQLLPWQLENGQQVEAHALVSLYEARGDFQLNIEMLRRGGLGRLFEAFERLKSQLESEGLFATERKRPVPALPRCIGIVTSLQAAALRDLLAALQRRAPHVPVVLYPTPVQGEGAAQQIAAAIDTASARGESDVLLVCRGGGSIEDLWSFNEEVVARAIAASALPVISGVGHETDFTIADFAADQRAATPTAAAELASAGWFAAADELAALDRDLRIAMRSRLEAGMQRLDLLGRSLLHPGERLARMGQQLAHHRTQLDAAMRRYVATGEGTVARLRLQLARSRPDPSRQAVRLSASAHTLRSAMTRMLDQRAHDMQRLHASLSALNPEATLARGYSIVRNPAGQVIRDSAVLQRGERIEITLARGNATAEIESTRQDP